MDGFPDLSVRVTTFDHRPVVDARVSAQSDAGAVATSTTDTRGRARLRRADAGELRVHVEAAGLEPQERSVSAERPERVELFVLGRPGMPFYYRGTVRVPFQPIDYAVGVVLRDPGAAAGEPGLVDPSEVTARAQRLTEDPNITLLRSEGNFANSGIAVIGVPGDRVDPDPDVMLGRIGARDDVAHVGTLVRLSDQHASFLTDMVVARFAEGWTTRRWPNSRAATGSPRLAASATSATSTGCALAVGPPTRCWMPATPSPPRQRSSGQSQT
jgi:hypothetical protein